MRGLNSDWLIGRQRYFGVPRLVPDRRRRRGAEELSERAGDGDPAILDAAAEVLTELHRAKTSARRSLRTDVQRLVIEDVGDRVAALLAVQGDLRQAGCVVDLVLREAPARADRDRAHGAGRVGPPRGGSGPLVVRLVSNH